MLNQSLDASEADWCQMLAKLNAGGRHEQQPGSRQIGWAKRGKEKTTQGIRKKSSITLLGLPLYHIATGPDLNARETCGHAKGIIAIGDRATGWVAIGGMSRGIIAIGASAVGLLAFGGIAVGGFVFGGAAVGIVSGGGAAVGCYTFGGAAFGIHVLGSISHNAEILAVLKKIIPGLNLPAG
jgi:hypothetical protein